MIQLLSASVALLSFQDNFKKLLHLQTRLGESDLVQANRELLREGAIQKISRSGIDMRYLILCSDTLIIARYASAGASLVVGTGSAGKSDSSSSSAPLRTRYKIPLSSVKVVPKHTLHAFTSQDMSIYRSPSQLNRSLRSIPLTSRWSLQRKAASSARPRRLSVTRGLQYSNALSTTITTAGPPSPAPSPMSALTQASWARAPPSGCPT